MRLEMGNIYIKDIQFADTSKIEDGILYVDKGAVKAVALEDEHIKTVTFDIAKPGESVRITPRHIMVRFLNVIWGCPPANIKNMQPSHLPLIK